MSLHYNIFVDPFPRVWPLDRHALSNQTQTRLHPYGLLITFAHARSFDTPLNSFAHDLLLSLTVAINQTILNGEQYFASQNNVKSVVVISSRANFISFPQKHVFHFST